MALKKPVGTFSDPYMRTWVEKVEALVGYQLQFDADVDGLAGGTTTQTFEVKVVDLEGKPVSEALIVGLQAVDSEDGGAPNAGYNFNTATKGSFVSGENAEDAVVKTNANGVFAATLTQEAAAAATIYIKAYKATGSPALDTRGRQSITYPGP